MAIKSSNQITFTEQKKIVEIKEWYLATDQNTGITVNEGSWTQDMQSINAENKYLWNYEEVVYSIGSSDISEPVIIGYYGEGKGIRDIINYYQVTQNIVTPELPTVDNMNGWTDDATVTSNLSSTNKYLWNYETIIYTDDTSTMTSPAIIGVYGDSGADAITFKIYSVDGFMFKKDLESIELKIAAFEGSEVISGATYTWEWWDGTLNDGIGGYSLIIEGTTDHSFIVNKTDVYAFASLRCTMNYDEKTYEDYIVLTDETVIYSATVKFFDGSNIFTASDPYIVAYVELYQNNNRIETIAASSYCSGISAVSDGVITTTLTEGFLDGDRMYFIYQDTDNLYKAVLGEYLSGVWNVVEETLQHVYINTLYSDIRSNIIVISKESINKSQNIDFSIYKDGTCIANANTMIIDSNDPIVSSEAPNNAVYGQLWLDTSVSPNVLKIFTQIEGEDAGTWIVCTEQIGGAVFTSQPTSYSKGDLWILAEGEACDYTVDDVSYTFGPGSMLKSTTDSDTYTASHWIDADAATTELKNSILQTFTFNPSNEDDKGLPGLTIGQTDQEFYVNISSTEMGFYDNSEGQNQKVVNISNNAAIIKDLTVEVDAEFNCDASFNGSQVNFFGFVWKKEPNGSMSLVLED